MRGRRRKRRGRESRKRQNVDIDLIYTREESPRGDQWKGKEGGRKEEKGSQDDSGEGPAGKGRMMFDGAENRGGDQDILRDNESNSQTRESLTKK